MGCTAAGAGVLRLPAVDNLASCSYLPDISAALWCGACFFLCT
jgi:hypothetical protein